MNGVAIGVQQTDWSIHFEATNGLVRHITFLLDYPVERACITFHPGTSPEVMRAVFERLRIVAAVALGPFVEPLECRRDH